MCWYEVVASTIELILIAMISWIVNFKLARKSLNANILNTIFNLQCSMVSSYKEGYHIASKNKKNFVNFSASFAQIDLSISYFQQGKAQQLQT